MIDSWWANIKVGDKAVLKGHWEGYKIITVERLTKTQVIMSNGGRWRRGDYSFPVAVGGDGWHRESLLQPTPENLSMAERSMTIGRFRALASEVERHSELWETDTLKEVCGLLEKSRRDS